ncbi:MAG: hypothetical protein J07HN6_01231 [Halonotius sp. J07HN6]|nr:MAG: hypothetical protein J07HN6_01231 [Halonotius sp. J07HN6]
MLEERLGVVGRDCRHRILILEGAAEDDIVTVVGVLSEDAFGVAGRDRLGVIGFEPVELIGNRLAPLVVRPRPAEITDLRVIYPCRTDIGLVAAPAASAGTAGQRGDTCHPNRTDRLPS